MTYNFQGTSICLWYNFTALILAGQNKMSTLLQGSLCGVETAPMFADLWLVTVSTNGKRVRIFAAKQSKTNRCGGKNFYPRLSMYKKKSELSFKYSFIEWRNNFELDSSHLLTAYFLVFLKFPSTCTAVGLLYTCTLAGPRTVFHCLGLRWNIKKTQEIKEHVFWNIRFLQSKIRPWSTIQRFNVLFY